MPTKMPEKFVQPDKRPLSELKIGESTFVMFGAVELDQNCEVYLTPTAEMRTEGGSLTVFVRRDENGYHIVVHDEIAKWRKAGPKEQDRFQHLIPVATVEEGPAKRKLF